MFDLLPDHIELDLRQIEIVLYLDSCFLFFPLLLFDCQNLILEYFDLCPRTNNVCFESSNRDCLLVEDLVAFFTKLTKPERADERMISAVSC